MDGDVMAGLPVDDRHESDEGDAMRVKTSMRSGVPFYACPNCKSALVEANGRLRCDRAAQICRLSVGSACSTQERPSAIASLARLNSMTLICPRRGTSITWGGSPARRARVM